MDTGPKVEHVPFCRMVGRMIRAMSKRVGDGDMKDLAAMMECQAILDDALRETVERLRTVHGYSWADIASAAGMTKAGAYKRWKS